MVKPLFSNPSLKGNFREIRQAPALQITEATSQSTNWVGGNVVRIAGPGPARILVSYPGVSGTSPDRATFSVLQELVTASLKTGSAFLVTYTDAGLFGIYSEGSDAAQLSVQLQNQLKTATSSVSEDALAAAKKTAKVRFLSYSEDPLQLTQLLVHRGPTALDAEAVLKQIDAVSVADIQRVVAELHKAGSVVVAGGDVRGVGKL